MKLFDKFLNNLEGALGFYLSIDPVISNCGNFGRRGHKYYIRQIVTFPVSRWRGYSFSFVNDPSSSSSQVFLVSGLHN